VAVGTTFGEDVAVSVGIGVVVVVDVVVVVGLGVAVCLGVFAIPTTVEDSEFIVAFNIDEVVVTSTVVSISDMEQLVFTTHISVKVIIDTK